jgi:hypothetical protein
MVFFFFLVFFVVFSSFKQINNGADIYKKKKKKKNNGADAKIAMFTDHNTGPMWKILGHLAVACKLDHSKSSKIQPC